MDARLILDLERPGQIGQQAFGVKLDLTFSLRRQILGEVEQVVILNPFVGGAA